jgi:cysteine-rich repeat protein
MLRGPQVWFKGEAAVAAGPGGSPMVSPMFQRRHAVSTVLLACLLASCGPSDSTQTVGFVLDQSAKKLDRLNFRVKYARGEFAGDDGGCTPGSLVVPGASVAVDRMVAVSADQVASSVSRGIASTSSTSTSTTTTSTTTTLGPMTDCTVTFRLDDAVTFGALQWETTYAASGGDFVGIGGDVECRSLVSGLLTAFNDNETANRLDAGLITTSGFTGPANLLECEWTGPDVPAKSDFVIAITEAVTVDFEPLEPDPDVIVQSITCTGPPTTTTSSTTTTTTTLPVNPCGDGVLGGGEECDDGNLVSGDGCDSSCDLEDTFVASVAPGQLNVDIVHRDGIPPGAALAFCKYQGEITAGTFTISVQSCSLDNSDGCNTTTDAIVKVSTTTTTTTTTTVPVTSTTDTTTTSSTLL